MVKEITEKAEATFPLMRVNSTSNRGKVLNLAPTIREVRVYSAKTVEKTSKLPLRIPGRMLGMMIRDRTWKMLAPRLWPASVRTWASTACIAFETGRYMNGME